MIANCAPTHQTGLFQASDLPEGFRYCEDVVTAEEERRLVADFAALPFKPFEFHGYLGKRRIVSFGYCPAAQRGIS